MARKMAVTGPREKLRVRRKGRHSKRVKARVKKQTFYTQGACRG
jgi:hypothetical protein